jgi:D-alanine-D-alanine ligase
VDIRVDENDDIYLLEINSMASLGTTGSYVHAASVLGYDYSKLINKMLDVAAVRYFSERLVLPDETDELDKAKLSLHVRMRMFLRSKQVNHERLLSKITNINTYVRNVEGVNTVGQSIWKELSSLNFVHQSIPQVEIGNLILLSNSNDNNYDVLLIGNLDNSVPFKKHSYFRETEHKLYGSGIWSSKGGLVVMVAALRALRFVRLLRKLKIGILLTTDDTLQGRISKNHIEEISKRARVVLGISGGSLEGSIVTSRSGAAVYDCQMNLVKTDNAMDVAEANANFSRLLTSLVKLSDESDKLIISPRDVRISSDIGSLYAHGEASLSIRFNSPDQAEVLDHKIHQLVKKSKKEKIQVQISGALRRSPMIRTSEIEKVFQILKKIADRIDLRIIEEHRWSSSNICFVDINKPKIDGLGPIGAKQKEEEYILRHSILDRSLMLALLLNEVSKKELKK